MEAAGRKVGMIGTNGIYYMGRHKDTCLLYTSAADVHHYAHLCQQQDQAGTAGREEGQADAGVGQGVGDHGDVAEHLPGDLRHNANPHHGAELVLGLIG